MAETKVCGNCIDFLRRKDSSIPNKTEGGCADRTNTGRTKTYNDSLPATEVCFKINSGLQPPSIRFKRILKEFEARKNKPI